MPHRWSDSLFWGQAMVSLRLLIACARIIHSGRFALGCVVAVRAEALLLHVRCRVYLHGLCSIGCWWSASCIYSVWSDTCPACHRMRARNETRRMQTPQEGTPLTTPQKTFSRQYIHEMIFEWRVKLIFSPFITTVTLISHRFSISSHICRLVFPEEIMHYWG